MPFHGGGLVVINQGGNGGTGGGGTVDLPAEHVASSADLFVNDSNTNLSALTGTTPSLPAGDYEITVSYLWSKGGGPNSDFIANLLVDGTNVTDWGGDMHRAQPSNAGGGNVAGTETNQSYPVTMTFHRTFTSSGIHTFDLVFHSEFDGDRSSVRDVRVAFRQLP